MFRSAYWVNVFDKLFGYQYHLSATLAKRLNSHLWCKLSCHSAFRRFNGANSSQKKKHTIGIALEKGLGSDRINVACGVEMSELPKLCGAEEYAINESGMKCRG